MRTMSVMVDVNQLYGLSTSEDDMDIDYMQACQDLLGAQRESSRRERRQETRLVEIDRRLSTLASAISSQRPTEIRAGCGIQESKYDNNVLKATIIFEIEVSQKSVSLYINISVPEDEAVDPELTFENVDGVVMSLNYSEFSEVVIINELRSLLSRSDKKMFSRT